MKYIWLIFALSSFSFAKQFKNQYCEFELPPGWECEQEGAEWICQSTDSDRKKEAIVIIAAKEAGDEDTIYSYKDYLKASKSFTLPGGKQQVSEPKYVKIRQVNSQDWVDSLHLASEVPGFYTRYLATIKGNLGIALTFSVSKEHYNEYQGLMNDLLSSLRVFQASRAKLEKFRLKSGDEDLLDNADIVDDFGFNQETKSRQKAKAPKQDDFMFYLLIGAAVLLFIIIRKKRG